MKISLRFTVLTITGLALAACSSAPSDDGSETSEGALSSYDCSNAETRKEVPNAPYGQVVDVRAAGHDGYDRFVIQFAGAGVPNYVVGRQEGAQFFQDGSGDLIDDVEGTAGINVSVHMASGWNMETGKPSYKGPRRFKPQGAKIVTEALSTGDFEGYYTWGLGLKRAACYRVFELTNPARLVVDIQNNGPAPTNPSAEPGTNFHCNGATIASGAMFGGPESNKPVSYGLVADVRAAAHPDYDRWVMEFKGTPNVPNFQVSKQNDAHFSGPGEGPESQFNLRGQAGLRISVSPASGYDFDHGHASWSGDRRFLVPGGTAMPEAAEYEDFEGYVGWGLGLKSQNACYRAFKLSNPPRLVVDVKK